MKLQLALISLLALASMTMFFQQDSVSMEEAELFQKYVQWKIEHNKFTNKGSDEFRFAVWSSNFKFVEQHNSKNSDLKLAVNQFADMDLEEFKAQMLTRQSAARTGDVAKRTFSAVPDSIDWRSKGVVSPIQNQGSCGSCWAFSAIATLNSLHAIKEDSLVNFSEQQLVSCDKLSAGCNGGNEYISMRYYTSSKGVELDSDYPYEQLNNSKTTACKYDESKVYWKNSGAKQVPANSPDAMKEAVAQGPISIAIDGASIYFQLYNGGVLDTAKCGTQLNHAVNIVGYDTTEGTPYWIVRNSWGGSWGQGGYAKFAIVEGDGVCGSQMEPCYATA
ncbi:hypothetical protein PPERSA_02008 [Pseudocohnilembus persalinus]|uniref:Uncharacterized protein n=1 Tax=Pseudocohnilembus persalinus TaxID=266149 RepID=A0A0V0QF71_PSEPJ|nr:hypothetical protein PPERSA_02008 [Pseudocohnilembus persalinus]|eukprot:KRX00829.1 hypothetical protein PPERSA_02008 [Pseudocohnilembus persalinus]